MAKVKTDMMLSALGHLNDEQFKVLFFIYNTINMNSRDSNRAKIYRAVLADLCGKSERTISRITDKLAEQGLIIKDSVSDGTKLYNYYSIPKQKTDENLVTDVRVKEPKSTIKNIKEDKEQKENKEQKEQKEFESFKKEVDEKLESCSTETELISAKAKINTTLNSKRIQLGTMYNRFSSYLNRKYEECLELSKAEVAVGIDDLPF